MNFALAGFVVGGMMCLATIGAEDIRMKLWCGFWAAVNLAMGYAAALGYAPRG